MWNMACILKTFGVRRSIGDSACRPRAFIKNSMALMAALFGMGMLTACATTEVPSPPSANSAASVKWQSALPAAANAPDGLSAPVQVQWQHRTFPGKKPGRYEVVSVDGRAVVASESDASASMLRQTVRVEASQLSSVKFSWKVPALIDGADMRSGDKSDSPARVVLAFEGDRSKFSARDAMLAELALSLTGEPMPYATLMYVWTGDGDVDSVLKSARTDRIRKLVVEAGPSRLGQWLEYERDVRADFVKAFGEEPGALVGVGIMSDTDNTRGQARAWFGPVSLANGTPLNVIGSALAGSTADRGVATVAVPGVASKSSP
jgi:Protein of unknown function (DUF3047)